MEGHMDALLQSRRENKRTRDTIGDALETLKSISIMEISQLNIQSESDILTLLTAKLGTNSLLAVQYLVKLLPPIMPSKMAEEIIQDATKETFAEGLTLDEVAILKSLVLKCESFMEYSPEKTTSNCANRTRIPLYSVLYPPTENCAVCERRLSVNGKPTHATVFGMTGPIPGMKITYKCQTCDLNFGYAMFGSSSAGYKYYDERRPYVEASNVAYLDRKLCLSHIFLANHAWVSFQGFTESYNEATEASEAMGDFLAGAKEGEVHFTAYLSRKVLSSGFFWHEIEEEFREREMIWCFKGTDEQALDDAMEKINDLRSSELYQHDNKDCSQICKEKGCSNFVSMDGIWKLRFPHCMYPVKSEVCGLPTLNYPSVCTKEPAGPQSALCTKHCQVASSKGIPTSLRAFVHDYCGVPRNVDETDPDSITITGVARVEETLQNISLSHVDDLMPSSVAEAQGTGHFFVNNKELLTLNYLPLDLETARCNKDTGERQKSLQKWSRGLMHFVRGGGHIDSWSPLFVSESPSQAFLLAVHYLYKRLEKVPEKEWGDFILSYDNMCNVCRMIATRDPLPLPEPYNMLWKKITKVIDLLHLRNHKNPKCKRDFSPQALKEKFPRLNTPVAEQTFVWAARFKKILCAMPQLHFLFFYHRMVTRRNRYTAKCYRENREPVLPKVRSSYSS